MKTLHLNLASHPYRDYRPVYLAAGAMGVLTAVLLFYNVQTGYRYLANTEETRAKIANVDTLLAKERSRTRSLADATAGYDLEQLERRSEYINAEIAERVFSWSELLDRLERVVPGDVRLETLNPTIDKDGRIDLNMTCTARNGDAMVEFLNRLFADPHFANPFPASEVTQPEGVRFSVSVEYRPAPTAGGAS